MTKAGHSDMKTTKLYVHMAGVVFREEADRLAGEVSLGQLGSGWAGTNSRPIAIDLLPPRAAEAR
jgi:hypothetical protein